MKLKEVTLQLETAENEASELKKERQNLNTKVEFLHSSLQKTSDELREKQKDVERFESETTRELNEITEKYSKKLSDSEQKCLELENKSVELEKQNVELTRTIEQLNGQIVALTREIEDHVVKGKKNKELVDELNVKLQQLNRQRDELQVSLVQFILAIHLVLFPILLRPCVIVLVKNIIIHRFVHVVQQIVLTI